MPHPHQLDEAKFDASLQTKLEERQPVIAIDGSHRHHDALELDYLVWALKKVLKQVEGGA